MKKRYIFLLILFFCFPSIVLANSKETVKFSKCIDGDTASFILNDEEVKVRFLAIDTPETKHPTKGEEPYGKEASNYTCEKLKNAKEIILEFDSNSDKLDKYNRYLAWVFVDGNLLQEELVNKGLAKVAYLYGDYKYTSILESKEETAKESKLGIWGDYQEEFSLKNFVKSMDLKYKILLTIIILIIVSIYLHFDKKARKKVLRKGKKEFKKLIQKK